MNAVKTLSALLVASSFAVGALLAADTPKEKAPEGKQAGCCVRAISNDETCGHACCVEAAKAKKNCEKCGGTNTAAPAPAKP